MTLRLLLLAALALAPAAKAPAAPAGGLAVLGLRPVEAGPGSATAITRLAEAQRLRAAVEGVAEALGGAPPLRHDDLRGALGRAYLVTLFDCLDDEPCLLAAAAPLRARGVDAALVGEYGRQGDLLTVRLRRLDLRAGRVAAAATFEVPAAQAEALAPWRAGLAPLFDDTGSLALVVNLAGAACTLDGRPCDLGPDGVLPAVTAGEHLLSLSHEGYRRLDRVVVVVAGQRLRVAAALEELPLQVVKAPDPASRLPTFAPPGEETRLAPFGSLRLLFLVDDVDAGEREEPAVPGGVAPGGAGLVVLPRPAVVGVSVQSPRGPGGWQLRGAVAAAFVKDPAPELDSAYAELLDEELGLRFLLGLGQSVFSGLTAGTLTSPEGFGDLAGGLVGLTASTSLGPVLLEGFVGKHKSQLGAEAWPGGAVPAPFLAARLAYVDAGRGGRLYGEDYPLTVSLSAVMGEERLGDPDEAAWAAEAGLPAPALERLPVRAASLELFLPLSPTASLAGEAWVGEGVHLLEGSLWQRPRLDPATGRHHRLRSAGGWLQLAVGVGQRLELRALAGLDAVVAGLGSGAAPFDEAPVSRNELAAVNGTLELVPGLSLGLQLHLVRTTFLDPSLGRPLLRAASFTGQVAF
ncbi:MAG: hypothetical protein IPO09_14810 [Anaeromyxobacter sp.]|nr:hypothetical protein [Anaeromyxobacter sp.]